jgi:hypothetical protein
MTPSYLRKYDLKNTLDARTQGLLTKMSAWNPAWVTCYPSSATPLSANTFIYFRAVLLKFFSSSTTLCSKLSPYLVDVKPHKRIRPISSSNTDTKSLNPLSSILSLFSPSPLQSPPPNITNNSRCLERRNLRALTICLLNQKSWEPAFRVKWQSSPEAALALEKQSASVLQKREQRSLLQIWSKLNLTLSIYYCSNHPYSLFIPSFSRICCGAKYYWKGST